MAFRGRSRRNADEGDQRRVADAVGHIEAARVTRAVRLTTVTGAQRALADFLRLDDLLAIAAPTSPPLDEIASDPGQKSVDSLPLSPYSALGALRQDPGRAAESPVEARTCGNQDSRGRCAPGCVPPERVA
jgi:hypothetical protein